jgi:hypothetical protein
MLTLIGVTSAAWHFKLPQDLAPPHTRSHILALPANDYHLITTQFLPVEAHFQRSAPFEALHRRAERYTACRKCQKHRLRRRAVPRPSCPYHLSNCRLHQPESLSLITSWCICHRNPHSSLAGACVTGTLSSSSYRCHHVFCRLFAKRLNKSLRPASTRGILICVISDSYLPLRHV